MNEWFYFAGCVIGIIGMLTSSIPAAVFGGAVIIAAELGEISKHLKK